jgi:asparagine synthase (glutamine-hydrolysing)
VTALAVRRSAKRIKTFTIKFPEYPAFDEGPYARIVADHFGTDHTEFEAEPASLELIPKLAKQFDEPMCDSSMIPTLLVSQLVKRQATVALSGDGGDELFGGYLHYQWLMRQARMRKLLPMVARKLVGEIASGILPIGFRGRNYMLGLGADENWGISHVSMFFDRRARVGLLKPLRGPEVGAYGAPETAKQEFVQAGRSLPRNARYVDFNTYLPDDILVKVDRASMLTSLEVRAPLLDYRIIEFAFSKVPDHLLVDQTERKILPRMLARKLLPEKLDLRRKQGFSIPLKTWLKRTAGNYVLDILSECSSDIFERRVIQELLSAQRRGMANAERVFGLTLFEVWRREYKVQLG